MIKRLLKSKVARLLLVLCFVALTIAVIVTPVMALPSRVLWETSTAITADSAVDIYLTNWSAQSFTTGDEAHTVSQIRLLLYREGSNGTTTVSLQKAGGTGAPNGDDLTSGTINESNEITTTTTGVWYGIDVTTVSLEANTVYDIVVRNPSGTSTTVCADWRMDGSAGAFAGGSEWLSTNSGISWTADTDDDYEFELWGESLIELSGAQVFRGYLELGDMLIALKYYNVYVPYYPNADVASYFTIQLRNTTGATVLAQTTCRAWGYKPGSIYLSADSAASLTSGTAYRIYVYGDFGANPEDYYTLTASDWRGDDLTLLDTWVLTFAHEMADYYSTDFTSYLVGQSGQEVLNTEGGVIFAIGIPGLEVVRSDLYELVSGIEGGARDMDRRFCRRDDMASPNRHHWHGSTNGCGHSIRR